MIVKSKIEKLFAKQTEMFTKQNWIDREVWGSHKTNNVRVKQKCSRSKTELFAKFGGSREK